LAELAKVLSHPARVEILRILAERQGCVCGEVVEVLPLAQATVSQHLKELKQAGLVSGTVEGPYSCYCLNPAGLAELQTLLQQLWSALGQPIDPGKAATDSPEARTTNCCAPAATQL
jgi:DNA-binding transcriptional ArsR family regulator